MILAMLLSAVMLASAGAGLALRRRAPWIGAAMTLMSLLGLYFVWAPDELTAVARALGVGRGTDLVLYLWGSLSFLALGGLVMQVRHLQRQLTLLARDVALERVRRQTSDAQTLPPLVARKDISS